MKKLSVKSMLNTFIFVMYDSVFLHHIHTSTVLSVLCVSWDSNKLKVCWTGSFIIGDLGALLGDPPHMTCLNCVMCDKYYRSYSIVTCFIYICISIIYVCMQVCVYVCGWNTHIAEVNVLIWRYTRLYHHDSHILMSRVFSYK